MPAPPGSQPQPSPFERLRRPTHRRTFLAAAGASTAGLFVAGCGGSGNGGTASTATTQAQPQAQAGGGGVTLDFSSVVGVLNYAYALEQLEAAFYTQVNQSPPSDATSADMSALADIMAHEVAHREFFKAKLGSKAIGALTPDFSKVDFSTRKGVLGTASTFENLGVAAYNGAGQFIDPGNPLGTNPIMAAGEIVSVEARHAATIDALISAGHSDAFAPQAFDNALKPSEVLPKVAPFIKTKVQVVNLPSNG